MKLLELFSGSGIMSKTFKRKGYKTFTIDNSYEADLNKDIMKLNLRDIPFNPDVVWASPPCQCFSVASISTHWKGGIRAYIPKTQECKDALELLDKTIYLIWQTSPLFWFIENPRGVMRKVIDDVFNKYGIKDHVRNIVTYCQYGDSRMKPTDIWTNNKNWKPRPTCKNGDSCHVSAPRGAKTGTQGLKGSYDRSKLPKELCLEIAKSTIFQNGDKDE